MKKAMIVPIVCAIVLSACGNVTESVDAIETSAVSQTTTTDTTLAATSTKKEIDTNQTTTTTRKTSQTASETSMAKTTTKSVVTSSVVSKTTTQKRTEQQSHYPTTESPREETQINTTQEPVVTTQRKQTTTKQTTVAPQKPATTTQKPQTTTKQTTTQKPSTTQPQETVEWSESMKTWRKLCEGKNLSQREQNLIRSEILEYAEKFNGQKDIHVSFGINEYDISYEKPLNMTVREDMTDPKLYAHMNAFAYAADYLWLIEYAESEEEIYDLVSEAREDCLHVIDQGLFNRCEIYTINGYLKYASDFEFNIGFDEDMYIWFLTKD